MICRWSLGRGVGDFWSGKDLGKAKILEWWKTDPIWKGLQEEERLRKSRMWRRLTVTEAAFEKMNVTEDVSWTLRNVDFLGKVLGIRDTCRHPDESIDHCIHNKIVCNIKFDSQN